VLEVALRADPGWLALAFVPLLCRFLIWGFKWYRMLRRREAVPFTATMRFLMIGVFVNLTTPSAKLAGGIVRSLMLHRDFGWRRSVAYGWALADQITNSLGFLLLFSIAAAMTGRTSLLVAGAAAFALLLAILSLRGFAWRRIQRPDLAERVIRWLPSRLVPENRGRVALERVQNATGPFLHDPRMWGDVVVSAASFGCICLSNALVLRSLGVGANIWSISVAVAIGYFAGTGLSPWGGIGVTEAVLATMYTQLGVPAESAAAGALLHRAGFYLVVTTWGGAALLRQGHPRRRRS